MAVAVACHWEGGAQTLLFLVELEQIRLENNYDHDYIAFLALFFKKFFRLQINDFNH